MTWELNEGAPPLRPSGRAPAGSLCLVTAQSERRRVAVSHGCRFFFRATGAEQATRRKSQEKLAV